MDTLILEVIGFNIDSCTIAQEAGADRVELCAGPNEGGTTPSAGLIVAARKKLNIPLYVMIRPRGGDFLYSDDEFQMMKIDISFCKNAGCDGIVTGILNADGSIDHMRCSILSSLAYPLGITFHRAFDRANDPFTALEDIIGCGYERILTSGQAPSAEEGKDVIRDLVKAADSRIIIMPGSGIRPGNITDIAAATNATEFHSSARLNKSSGMNYKNDLMKEDLQSASIDPSEIRLMKKELASLKS